MHPRQPQPQPPYGLALLLRHAGRYGEGALYPLACDGEPSPSQKKQKQQHPTTSKRRARLPALPPHLTREGLWAQGEEDRPVHRLRLLEPGAAHKHEHEHKHKLGAHSGEEGEEDEELTARPFFSPFQHWTHPHVAFPSFVLDLATPAGGTLFVRPLEEVRRVGLTAVS